MPPKTIIPPPIKNLKKTIDGKQLKLTWSSPAATDNERKSLGGFVVYRSKYPINEPPCEKCPILFDQISDIPAHNKKADFLYEYTETLENGFLYYFKVKIYTQSNIPGNDSNVVRFRFPSANLKSN